MIANAKPMSVDFLRLVNNGYAPNELADFVRTSPYFCAAWYERQYPGLEYHEGCPDAAFHYANYGYKEAKLPSPLFDGNRYSEYHNLKDVNPLLHYIASGTPGRYRSFEFGQEIVAKYNANNTSLLRCERVYVYELLYKERLGVEINLCGVPATLSEKLFSIKAFGADMLNQAAPLVDAKTMSKTLMSNYGFSADEVINVKAVCEDTDKIRHALKNLPEAFAMICNGMQGTVISTAHKDDIKHKNNLRLLEAIQAQAQGANAVDKLHPVAKVKPDFIIFDNKVFTDPDHRLMQVVCFNGKAQFIVVTGPNDAMTITDCELNVLPVAISTGEQGVHPREAEFAKPECLKTMLCKAETVAHDFKTLTMLFAVSGKDFCSIAVRTELFNGMFKLTDDYDLRFGARLDLAD